MGNSLHNKIHLGRSSVMSDRRIQAAMLVGVFASIGLMWLVIRTYL